MLKANAYHVLIKRLDTEEEKGFILSTGERGYSMSVTGADSLAPITSEGEMQYGDFLNICVFAQNNWSGNRDYQDNLIAGPSGVKYWKPEQSYSAMLPTGSYWQSRNLDTTTVAGELSLAGGATLMANFPDSEGTISCFQYYDGKIYVGLSSSPKIYFTDDYGITWTLLLDLTTDFRSQFNTLEEIVDLWWDTNGAMGDTLFFAAKKTNNSVGYMLRYSADQSPKDQVKEDNYGGVPITGYTDTTIIKIAPETDSGNYSALGDSDSDAFIACDAVGNAISSWGPGSETLYLKVPENVFLKNIGFHLEDSNGDWHNSQVTALTNIGGGFDVLTLYNAMSHQIGAIAFSGSGNDDMTNGGAYTDVTDRNYVVRIDGGIVNNVSFTDYGSGRIKITSSQHGLSNEDTVVVTNTTNYNGSYSITIIDSGSFYFSDTYVSNETGTFELTPNTFKWSPDGGSTWYSSGVAITGGAQTLNNGITITFAATTGHNLNATWSFTAKVVGYNGTDDYRIRNKIAVPDATKFYIGDMVTIDNGVDDTYTAPVIGIDTGTNNIYLDDSTDCDFGTGAGTFDILRSTINGLPIEVNTASPAQGLYVSIDDKIHRIAYAYNGNNQAIPDNTVPPYPKSWEGCIHSTGYSTSMMPSAMASHVDARNYFVVYSSFAYPSAAVGTALVYEKITSLQCNSIPIGGRLLEIGSFVAVAISGNNMTTNYYPNISDYNQYSYGGADYTHATNGISTIYADPFQTTSNVKPNKIHQVTATGGLLTTGDILIATQKVPLAVDSTIYYIDGLTNVSTKPFGADLISSSSIKDITQDSAGQVHTIISPEGKHWLSTSSASHDLKYTLLKFDNDETYPDSIEFWNGSVWYANPADTTCYKYDISTDAVLPVFGMAVTAQTSLRFPAILGAGSYLYVESNESQKTFRYDEGLVADSGWLESSDYAGLIPAVNKNWLYAKVITRKLLTDTTAKVRLQVSFDMGSSWYYLPSVLGLAWETTPASFDDYESGLTQAPDGISHTFYFPYNSKNARVMYRINLIKGTTEKPVVTNISLHYNILEDKEEIYSYLFVLNKAQELLDGSNKTNKHLEDLAFLKEIWRDELVCEITHVDGSIVKALPFKPANITGGGINVNYGGFDSKFRNTDDIEYAVQMSFKTIAPYNT